VTSPEDILEDLAAGPPMQLQLDIGEQVQRVRQSQPDALQGLERTIYEFLTAKGPLGSSAICTMCGQPAETVQTALFSLEFNHWIARRNDGLFEV
jgi:predicted Rossmann fold nucleotide-binding protein DprA/Smf involved in DNA uptake